MSLSSKRTPGGLLHGEQSFRMSASQWFCYTFVRRCSIKGQPVDRRIPIAQVWLLEKALTCEQRDDPVFDARRYVTNLQWVAFCTRLAGLVNRRRCCWRHWTLSAISRLSSSAGVLTPSKSAWCFNERRVPANKCGRAADACQRSRLFSSRTSEVVHCTTQDPEARSFGIPSSCANNRAEWTTPWRSSSAATAHGRTSRCMHVRQCYAWWVVYGRRSCVWWLLIVCATGGASMRVPEALDCDYRQEEPKHKD